MKKPTLKAASKMVFKASACPAKTIAKEIRHEGVRATSGKIRATTITRRNSVVTRIPSGIDPLPIGEGGDKGFIKRRQLLS